ncbi:MAG: cytochrome c maturation protein CcmE [Magnetococcales bacterium]|nr:cytochrome c maturation protein CcmE [Magnetococcales bacterium]
MTILHNKRLLLILTLLVVVGALLALVFTSFTDALVYFHTPTEIQAASSRLDGKKIRIGGMVQAGSLHKTPDTLQVAFLVTDGSSQLPVTYEGMLPDLFREGQGVVVEGTWRHGQPFQAATVLAKHSEDYMPVEMTEAGIEKARQSILKTLQ